MPRVVEDGVFDAWSWCESDWIDWTAGPEGHVARRRISDGTNPSDLLFLMHAECSFLPRELAHLHASGIEGWALAPWAIDDATDGFYEHRVRPRDVLRLHAPSIPALVWGLHDWAHFHNHGPFDDPPMTELQCDLVALAWIRANADALGLGNGDIASIRDDLASLARGRFEGRLAPEPLLSLFSASENG